MLELIVDNIRPLAVYFAVDGMVYAYCLKNSIEHNHFVNDWRDHFGLAFDQVRGNPKLQLLPSAYVLLYYADKTAVHWVKSIQTLLNQ